MALQKPASGAPVRPVALVSFEEPECSANSGAPGALRDQGHARDYVQMQWRILQQETPKDYANATGEQHSVRQFVEGAARFLEIEISWKGMGAEEKGLNSNGKDIVSVDPPLSTH